MLKDKYCLHWNKTTDSIYAVYNKLSKPVFVIERRYDVYCDVSFWRIAIFRNLMAHTKNVKLHPDNKSNAIKVLHPGEHVILPTRTQ